MKKLSRGDDSVYSKCVGKRNINRHYTVSDTCCNTSKGDQFCLRYGKRVVYRMEVIYRQGGNEFCKTCPPVESRFSQLMKSEVSVSLRFS